MVNLRQFFVSQGRAKIRVPGLEEFERLGLGRRIELTMAGLPPLLRDQSLGPLMPVSFQQPFNLTQSKINLIGRLLLGRVPWVPLAEHLHTTEFFLTHVDAARVTRFLPVPFLWSKRSVLYHRKG